MLLRSDFSDPKYLETTKRIAERMAMINLDIRKTKESPYCKGGIIFVTEASADDMDWFSGELIHEAGHLFWDPLNWINALDGIAAIGARLNKTPARHLMLANVASDIICSFHCSRDFELSKLRAKAIDKIFEEASREDLITPLKSELFGILSRLHPTNFRWKSNLFKRVCQIMKTKVLMTERYADFAKLFENLADQEERIGHKRGKSYSFDLKGVTLRPTVEEIEQAINRACDNAENIGEVEKSIETIRTLIGTDCQGTDRKLTDADVLNKFFEEQSRKLILSVAFPSMRTRRAMKLGTRMWRLSDGVARINVKKTLRKSGVNIPLVTSRTDIVTTRLCASETSVRPMDLVVSIDCSDSTGTPTGNMDCAADYEIILFFSLVNLSHKIKQRIGLTLWSEDIRYTTLPATCEGVQAETLKKKCTSGFGGKDTRICTALLQARKHLDKFFFLITDGAVRQEELAEVSNVFFFLVCPQRDHLDLFTGKYGEERVAIVERLEALPTVVISKWVKNFWNT